MGEGKDDGTNDDKLTKTSATSTTANAGCLIYHILYRRGLDMEYVLYPLDLYNEGTPCEYVLLCAQWKGDGRFLLISRRQQSAHTLV